MPARKSRPSLTFSTDPADPPVSPPHASASSRISPRPKPAKLKSNSNPFAPLSPDLPENSLTAVAQSLTPSKPTKSGQLRYYPREKLLGIAKKCEKRGWERPKDLVPLETWFGCVWDGLRVMEAGVGVG